MPKRILVTGGAGYIGSHTVKRLLERGYAVTVLDNMENGNPLPFDVDFVEADIGDTPKVREILEGREIDAVVHFAASAQVAESVRDPRKYYRNNVLAGMGLLDGLMDAGVDKIVFSSSCATYGVPDAIPIDEGETQVPINPYGWTKLFFERILRDYDAAYGLRSVSLRYFNAAGADEDGEIGEMHDPETHVIPILLEVALGKRPGFSVFGTDYDTRDGSCIRDYVHVTDLADAHIAALEYLFKGGRTDAFNLGTGDGISVLELVDAVERITGKKLKVAMEARRPGDPAVLVADNRKAREILGWVPEKSSLDNIVETAWKWHSRKV
ncbi:MAG: UDP-glucose 4-epimerase GalE [Thermoplasmatales archaeon]|nr:UDP-glucose 4-epimerase GalE [Thermoplasmatales archaeon]